MLMSVLRSLRAKESEDRLGDAHRFGYPVGFDDRVDIHLHSVADVADVADVGNGGSQTDSRPDWHRRRKANLVETVIDCEIGVGDRQRLGPPNGLSATARVTST
jgi:hypothetical protein